MIRGPNPSPPGIFPEGNIGTRGEIHGCHAVWGMESAISSMPSPLGMWSRSSRTTARWALAGRWNSANDGRFEGAATRVEVGSVGTVPTLLPGTLTNKFAGSCRKSKFVGQRSKSLSAVFPIVRPLIFSSFNGAEFEKARVNLLGVCLLPKSSVGTAPTLGGPGSSTYSYLAVENHRDALACLYAAKGVGTVPTPLKTVCAPWESPDVAASTNPGQRTNVGTVPARLGQQEYGATHDIVAYREIDEAQRRRDRRYLPIPMVLEPARPTTGARGLIPAGTVQTEGQLSFSVGTVPTLKLYGEDSFLSNTREKDRARLQVPDTALIYGRRTNEGQTPIDQRNSDGAQIGPQGLRLNWQWRIEQAKACLRPLEQFQRSGEVRQGVLPRHGDRGADSITPRWNSSNADPYEIATAPVAKAGGDFRSPCPDLLRIVGTVPTLADEVANRNASSGAFRIAALLLSQPPGFGRGSRNLGDWMKPTST